MMNQSGADTATIQSSNNIFAAIELSSTAWVVAIHSPTKNKISIARITSGDVDRLIDVLERSRALACTTGTPAVQIHTCYEAGYDGFWLHRLLVSKGIHNQVLDSASIQVSRRRRNAKTDRIDAESLVRVLMALHRGETKVCSVVHVPSPEEEDVKRLHRSRATLVNERVRHVNRIKGLLKLQGVHHIEPNRKGWTSSLRDLHAQDGSPFPPHLLQEIKREAKLLAVVRELLREVCADIEQLVSVTANRAHRNRQKASPHPIATRLMQVRGIGPTFASVLATEVFYRQFANRRAVASYVGLTPTPYSSGSMDRDQGISKAGNARARRYAVELAWLWLRNQPTSKLTAWFKERVTIAKGRVRRIAIVALARKLIVALWRYLETGLVPDGAMLKG